jgi:hypothetical protein
MGKAPRQYLFPVGGILQTHARSYEIRTVAYLHYAYIIEGFDLGELTRSAVGVSCIHNSDGYQKEKREIAAPLNPHITRTALAAPASPSWLGPKHTKSKSALVLSGILPNSNPKKLGGTHVRRTR